MSTATIPVASLSIWDPIHLGTDETGNRVEELSPNATCSSAANPAAASPSPSS
jgi:hypothetical protein